MSIRTKLAINAALFVLAAIILTARDLAVTHPSLIGL